jgi:hypothetical protein
MDRRWILYALAFLVTSSVSGVGASRHAVSSSRRASTRDDAPHPPTRLRALFACVSVIPPAADAADQPSPDPRDDAKPQCTAGLRFAAT